MARSLDFTSGDTIGIGSGDGAKIDDVVYGTAQAWCVYDQDTPTIVDSYNVSSVSDDGVGSYTVTLSITMADANYALVGMCYSENQGDISQDLTKSTTQYDIETGTFGTGITNTNVDITSATVVFGSR